jgi:hypothetical protein
VYIAGREPDKAGLPPSIPFRSQNLIRLVCLRPFHSVAKREGEEIEGMNPPPLGSFSRAEQANPQIFFCLSGSNQSVIIKAEGGFVVLLPCL